MIFRPPPSEEEDPHAGLNRARPGFIGRILQTVRLYFAILLALPFLFFLIPIWVFFWWHERRHGRPPPPFPFAPLFHWQGFPWMRHRQEHDSPPRQENRRPAPCVTMDQVVMESGQERPGRGTAVVTGGAKRIGAAICRELAGLGYHVAVCYRDSVTEAEDLVAELRTLGVEAASFAVELRNPRAMEQLMLDVEDALGPITLLVNNASQFAPTRLQDCSWEGMENLTRVNLLAPLWLAVLAQRRMAAGGLIINLCDIWGERPLRGHTAYSASKAGLIMATRSLAREMAPEVRVNAIAPGALLPREAQAEEGYRQMLGLTPLAEQAAPEAVLRAIRYLISAHYVTGEVLHVDGGRRWVS